MAPRYLAPIAVAPFAVYGPQRMLAGYDGPLFNLRRDSDGATIDVPPQAASDYPDYAAIDAWADGAALTVSQLHDQSGNARHMVQPLPANQPSFDTAQRFGNTVPILFDGFGRTATAANPHVEKTLLVGALSGLDAATMSAFMAVQPQTSANGVGYWFGSYAAGDTATIEVNQGTTTNALTIRFGGANKKVSPTTLGPQVHFTPGVLGLTLDGAGALRQWANGNAGLTGGVATASAPTERLTLGKALVGGNDYYGAFRLFGIAFYAAPVDDAGGATVVASLDTALSHGNGFGAAPEYNLLFIGDSIMEGTGSRLLQNIPHHLSRSLTRPRRMFNYARHGEQLSAACAQRTGRFADTPVAGIANVAFVQGGINDIGAGSTGAGLYGGTLAPLVGYLQGIGYRVAVCTLTPRTDQPWTAALEGERLAYNAAVTDNAAGADAVLDLTANPAMGPVAAADDTALYGDHLHPTSLGYAYLAGARDGAHAAAATFYASLTAILRTTSLGASYVP